MPTDEKILDKVISVLRTWDNDVYSFDYIRNNKDTLVVGSDGLGLGSTRSRYAAHQINEYIITNGGDSVAPQSLVKLTDTVHNVADKVKKSIG